MPGDGITPNDGINQIFFLNFVFLKVKVKFGQTPKKF